MTGDNKKMSELRRDPVSGEWVVVATRRIKGHLHIEGEQRERTPKSKCPFENPQESGNEDPIFYYPEEEPLEEWSLQVIENKFPAFIPADKEVEKEKLGPYQQMDAKGHHELVITKDHDDNFPRLSPECAMDVFKAFQRRFKSISEEEDTSYISVFHNWGPKAGASVYHPHYQIISMPVIPSDVHQSLKGSKRYQKENQECVHCEMIEEELKEETRIVFENDSAVCFAPFVSKEPFELRVFPKNHSAYFEEAGEEVLSCVVSALQNSLGSLEANLGDPDYNFFIHSAPVEDSREFDHYHWHIEIRPRVSISAGFEAGTGMEVTVVSPEAAAQVLQGLSVGIPKN